MSDGLRSPQSGSLPVPLPVPAEPLVVVELVGDTADTSVLHTPAPTRRYETGTQIVFADVKWPYRWVSVCGVEGYVYVRAGVLERVGMCAACLAVKAGPWQAEAA